MPQSKVAQRLKSLTDEPVVLLSEVLGFYATGTSFVPINSNPAVSDFLSESPVPETRGLLNNNDDTVPLLRRTFRDRIFVAKNPVYSSLLSPDFGRLYFQPEATNANMGHEDVGIDNFFSEDPERTFYLFPDAFDPGGYYYELAASGVNFQLEKADGTFETAEDIYGALPYSGPGLSEGTSNNNYSATTFLTQIFNGGDDSTTFPNERLPFVQSRFIHGDPDQFYTSINSNPNPAQGLEILTQISSYPSAANLVGEFTSFPQEFSLLLFDHKRNSHFAISLSSLANSIATIVNTLGNVVAAAPTSVNLTMPVLTTSQLNAFVNQTGAAAADLNADGSVSTADLLSFLTVFGQEGGETTVDIERAFNSSLQVHGFTYLNEDPFYTLSLESAIILENPPSSATTSHGLIDLDGYEVNSINPLVTFMGTGGFGIEFAPGSWWQSLMNDGLDDVSPTNFISFRAAHLALALYAYAGNGGVSTTLASFWDGDNFPVLSDFSESLTNFNMPNLSNFVCSYEVFLHLMQSWHPVLGRPLALEDFPDENELSIGAPFNYQYETVSVVFNDNPPDNLGQNISGGLPAFEDFTLENKPDYLLFGNGSPLEFTLGASNLGNQRIKTFLNGYVEVLPGSGYSVVFPYLITSGGLNNQNRTLVAFFGNIITGISENPITANGFERYGFSLSIDPASWGSQLNADTNSFFCNQGDETGSGGVNLETLFRAYPSSWNAQQNGLDAMFSIGAFSFNAPAHRIVVTGVSYEVLNTQGSEILSQ